jgi:Dolichyl-phosphate-mannose-protein mannosyltransferase
VRPSPFDLARWNKSAVAAGALAVLGLLGLYAWSHGGQATTAALSVRGSHVAVYVDGRLAEQAELEMPRAGGVFLTLSEGGLVPSLPQPRGIDRIRVTGPGGNVLFEDDFDSDPVRSGRWSLMSGSLARSGGVVSGAAGVATIYHAAPGWRDYDVEVSARNVTTLTVGVRATSPVTAAVFTTNPFRHIDAHLSAIQAGSPAGDSLARQQSFGTSRIARSIAAMFVDPLPLLAGCLVLLAALAVAASRFSRRAARPSNAALSRRATTAASLVLSLLAAGAALRLMLDAGGLPHVPDELSYLFQAKLLAAGNFAAEPPPSLAAFSWSDPSSIPVIDGKWASIYPFGHPLVLAVGYLIQAPWLIPPLLGGASVFLLSLVARRLYRPETALLATLLFAVSPFFLMTASNFMSHTTAAFFVLAALTFLAYADRSPLVFSLFAGVSLGLVFNTRPLTGAALGPAFALFMLAPLRKPNSRGAGTWCLLAFGLGCASMIAAYLLYRFLTTGDPLTTDPLQTGRDALGFWGSHTVAAGLSNEQTQTAYLMLVLHNWPVQLGVALALLPFALGSTRRWDWFLGLAAVSVMAAYAAYFYNGLMYGPRFWYEAAPLLILLSARGVEVAAERITRLASVANDGKRAQAATGVAMAPYVVVAGLALVGSYRWVSGTGPQWGTDFVPGQASELRPFNGVDPAMLDAVAKANLPANSLVLVKPCPNWQCYGSVFWLNEPSLDGPTVFAQFLPSELESLVKAFPDRLVYTADYWTRSVQPFPPRPGSSEAVPRAHELAARRTAATDATARARPPRAAAGRSALPE